MKRYLTMLLIFAMPLMVIAADETKKESSVKIRNGTKVETDTYFQGGDRVLEVKRVISLRDDNHTTEQKIFWKNSVVVELDISHMTSYPGQFLHFYSVPGVNVVTSAKPDGAIRSISLVTTNLTVLRSFRVVDGLLSPVPMTEVKKVNGLDKEVTDLFQDFQKGDISSDEFLNRVKGIVQKHNKENGATEKSPFSSEGAPSNER